VGNIDCALEVWTTDFALDLDWLGTSRNSGRECAEVEHIDNKGRNWAVLYTPVADRVLDFRCHLKGGA
jgi:hypothetical protein